MNLLFQIKKETPVYVVKSFRAYTTPHADTHCFKEIPNWNPKYSYRYYVGEMPRMFWGKFQLGAEMMVGYEIESNPFITTKEVIYEPKDLVLPWQRNVEEMATADIQAAIGQRRKIQDRPRLTIENYTMKMPWKSVNPDASQLGSGYHWHPTFMFLLPTSKVKTFIALMVNWEDVSLITRAEYDRIIKYETIHKPLLSEQTEDQYYAINR